MRKIKNNHRLIIILIAALLITTSTLLYTISNYNVLKDQYDNLNNNYNRYKQSHYMPKPREFRDIYELKIFLASDSTDEHEYIPTTFDCEDFAFNLTDNARRQGYLIYSIGKAFPTYRTIKEYIGYWDNTIWYTNLSIVDKLNNHAYCVTRIKGIWYKIEPQTDEITEVGPEL